MKRDRTYLCHCGNIFTIAHRMRIDKRAVCPKCNKSGAVAWLRGRIEKWSDTLMHDESMSLMRGFAGKYVTAGQNVVDVGSGDVNGTFRGLFDHCTYTGIDMEAGANVDRVVEPYDWGDEQYDVVISGSCLEHVPDTVAWVAQSIRVCKPGGLICVIAPHSWPEHKFPVDCYRFFPDGLRWQYRSINVLECKADAFDTILIAKNESPTC